jgi:hypothetical protein
LKRTTPEQQFLIDVAGHRMEVKLDRGLYRHLRFRRPGSWAYGFDITTWPGYLGFGGDAGEYVFCRAADMIGFFRQPEGRPIDYRYWAEKCRAADRNGGLEEFSPALFKSAVFRALSGASKEARQAAVRDVIGRAGDGEAEALRAAHEFDHDGFRFDAFWEYRVRDWSHRFLWCCHALRWAVARYDEWRAGQDERDRQRVRWACYRRR